MSRPLGPRPRVLVGETPDVFPLGDALIVRGLPAVWLEHFAQLGFDYVRRRDAITPPPEMQAMFAALTAAADAARARTADVRSERAPSLADVRSGGDPTGSAHVEWIGTAEAAETLRVSPRQASRLAHEGRLGVTRLRGNRREVSKAGVEGFVATRDQESA